MKTPKSSTHVIVVTLDRLGYRERKPASLNYHPGLKAHGIGHGLVKNLSIAEMALPSLRVLVDLVQMPAHLAIADGVQGIFIQKVARPSLIRIDTHAGRRMGLHCTGVGKVHSYLEHRRGGGTHSFEGRLHPLYRKYDHFRAFAAAGIDPRTEDRFFTRRGASRLRCR